MPGLPNWSNEAQPVRYDAQQRRFRPTRRSRSDCSRRGRRWSTSRTATP